jgi:hypothetical protein
MLFSKKGIRKIEFIEMFTYTVVYKVVCLFLCRYEFVLYPHVHNICKVCATCPKICCNWLLSHWHQARETVGFDLVLWELQFLINLQNVKPGS